MRFGRTLALATFVAVLTLPAQAYAADGQSSTIPEWLSIAMGAVGLLIAVILMIDAVLLRRVAEGSYVADNIAYMMSGVVCFAASMLASWAALFVSEAAISDQMSWAADLLVIAGMALLAVYFMRVRFAMQRYLQAVTDALSGASTPAEDVGDGDSASSGEEAGG